MHKNNTNRWRQLQSTINHHHSNEISAAWSTSRKRFVQNNTLHSTSKYNCQSLWQ